MQTLHKDFNKKTVALVKCCTAEIKYYGIASKNRGEYYTVLMVLIMPLIDSSVIFRNFFNFQL